MEYVEQGILRGPEVEGVFGELSRLGADFRAAGQHVLGLRLPRRITLRLMRIHPSTWPFLPKALHGAAFCRWKTPRILRG